MPYGIRKSGDKFKVVNKETGRVFGTHSTKEKAKKQLAALYIHAHPKNESALLDVRMVTKNGIRVGAIDVLAEAVRKDNLVKASSILNIEPDQLLEFIKSVDTDPDLPHGNWICMAAAKGMSLDAKTADQLRMMLKFFTKYKKQVTNAGKSANIFEYPDYQAFKDMVFSFGKHAYDYNPEELPGVTKVYEAGPFAAYRITVKDLGTTSVTSPELQSVLDSLGRMGIGTRWCTRAEGYGPSWKSNAYNYMVTNNPDKTMLIITKFNNPFIQLQKNLSSIMDVNDKPFDLSNSKTRRELSDVFVKIAGELNLDNDTSKSKYLSLVGVRTRKSFEYYLSKGYSEALLLGKLTVPMADLGFTDEESVDMVIKAVVSRLGDSRYVIDSILSTVLDNNPELASRAIAAAFMQGQIKPKHTFDKFVFDYIDRILNQAQDKTIEPKDILAMEPVVADFNLATMLYRWCVFVRDARWPEKEAIMKEVFDRDPRFAQIYYSLGQDVSEEDLSKEATSALIKQIDMAGKRLQKLSEQEFIRRGEDLPGWQAVKQSIYNFVITYGASPDIKKHIEDYLPGPYQRLMESTYKHAVESYSVEEVE
jgi:hypothetical protein